MLSIGSLFGALVVDPLTEAKNIEIVHLQSQLADPSLENPGAVHNNLGLCFMATGSIIDSIRHFKEALKIDENDPAANMNTGIAYKHMGQFEEAVTYFERSLQLRPTADEHYNLGNTFMKLGPEHNATAITHYKAALEIDPKHRLTCMNLGTALKAGGLLDEAISYMERSIEIAKEEEGGEIKDFNALYVGGVKRSVARRRK